MRPTSLRRLFVLSTLVLAALGAEDAKSYKGWQHSGSLFILTTPDGANLPASAVEEGFPLLVRLSKDNFDFKLAKTAGEDLRFSSNTGVPLAYQIEEWDAAAGTASVWVRIPTIKGNTHQELKMYWGKADAASESNGKAVFHESNGYLSVWHMSDAVKDEVGTLESQDTGTTAAAGIIGKSRYFPAEKGVKCGEKNTSYPTGSSPHSSEAWIRPEQSNTNILGWGNEQKQGKVLMQVVNPPHIRMDCYFSNGNVASAGTLALSQWIHVAHTYKDGESHLYVNGILDGSSISKAGPLAITSPARMYLGGWSGRFNYTGDMDEVRISKVTRSADWIRMEYENQKLQQTLVGSLVQAGTDFSVSEKNLTVPEGKTVTVSAKAGGAHKIYWIMKRDGKETIAAVDRCSFTVDAGRVTGDASVGLQFKAVYAGEIKTRDIPITIKETIPDPTFTVKAPSTWDGRETIEVMPQITNRSQMQAAGAGELKYTWTVSGLAVIKEVSADKLILKRSQNSGILNVRLQLSNGGTDIDATTTLTVKEPAKDAWVQRVPDKDEKPVDNQFYARDDKNEGSLFYNGTLSETADSVFLKLYADDKVIKTETQKPTADKGYAFTLKLKPGLIVYKVEFGTKDGGGEKILNTVNNLVCGDAYLIEGQSNALATDTREQSPPVTNNWIRSYGSTSWGGEKPEWKQCGWGNAVWKKSDDKWVLGWWGMELAKQLVEQYKIPICIINGSAGGTRIDQHLRPEPDHTDVSTIYGRMLWRIEHARLTHGIRAVIWHQGESDQGSDGPGGSYGWVTYQRYFMDMSAAWKQDLPNLQQYYIFQIWPNACSMGAGHGDMMREVQRTLPRLYAHMDILPTLGIKPAGPCHYPLVGWTEFARMVQPLLDRDFYGWKVTTPITGPDLKRVSFANGAKDTLTLEFDQPVVWSDGLISEFYLDDAKGLVATGSASGNVVTLKLKAPSMAQKITYVKEMSWSQDRLLMGKNGIAALTFCAVPLDTAKP